MGLMFNKDDVHVIQTPERTRVTVKAYDIQSDNSTPPEIIFHLYGDAIDRCIGDYKPYWTMETFIKSDEVFPMVTEACAYARRRVSCALSITHPNIITLVPADFVAKPKPPQEDMVNVPYAEVMQFVEAGARKLCQSLRGTEIGRDAKQWMLNLEIVFECLDKHRGEK